MGKKNKSRTTEGANQMTFREERMALLKELGETQSDRDYLQTENKELIQKGNELYKEFRVWQTTSNRMPSDRMLELLESFKCGWNPKDKETNV